MSRGVLLMAFGHRNYIGMAVNIAASIRMSDADVGITLYTTDELISRTDVAERKLFSEIRIISSDLIYHNGKPNYIKPKLHMYDLSPYDETLYLDVDMIIFPKIKISDVIEQLSQFQFTVSNSGYHINGRKDIHLWQNVDNIKKYYNDFLEFKTGKLYCWCSEFIWFKKNDDVGMMFEAAKEIYNKPRLTPMSFAGVMPDEYAFNIAGAATHIYPHKSFYQPLFDPHIHKFVQPKYLFKEYIGMSIGYNSLHADQRSLYDSIANAATQKAGIKQYTKARDKSQYLMERRKY